MAKALSIKNGKVFNNVIESYMDDWIGAVVDSKASLLKYGDSKSNIMEYYEMCVNEYKKFGLNDLANDLIYIQIPLNNDAIPIKNVVSLFNWMIGCSNNGSLIEKMMAMGVNDLNYEISKLNAMGY